MTYDDFTTSAQEAILLSKKMAESYRQQSVSTAHLLLGLSKLKDSTTKYLLNKIEVDLDLLESDLKNEVINQPKVSGDIKILLSKNSNKALSKAKSLMYEFGDSFISPELILLAILVNPSKGSKVLIDRGVDETKLRDAIKDLRKGRKVNTQSTDSQYNSLEKYAVDLVKQVEDGKLDPIIGRDEEMRHVLQILSRRKKNNPILIGEAGVGKTAIVEGIAWRIANKDVPDKMLNKKLLSLDLASLIAGAKYKGEFEERLKAVVKEVQASNGEIILFIDEIHTLIGAGGGNGAMDAANILKPALARGELHAIGATTFDEYQKYFEKDKALVRRFQKVHIAEPSISETISILRGIQDKYEVFHEIEISDDALVAAANLSDRYITDRFLPDKAIDLIDEAAAKLRLELDSMPDEIDELARRVKQLEIEKEGILREKKQDNLSKINTELSDVKEKMDLMLAMWQDEKSIIDEIVTFKKTLEEAELATEKAERISDFEEVAKLRYGTIKELEINIKKAEKKLNELPEENRFTSETVTRENIAGVVSKWTGIPISKMVQSEKDRLLQLESLIGKRLIGQKEAVVAVADAVRRSRSGMQDAKKPIGSFIFLGPTGVGKTELAKALAEVLFDDEDAIIRIDMSEYQEKHAVARLVGAPPGYVGYDEGGQLTEAVRHRPYSIILLDEIEKGHPDVFNILLQVLDDGRLTDNKGRVVNFKNTIIIMTSNIGSMNILENFEDLEEVGEEHREDILSTTKEEVFGELKDFLRPEFLNRIDEKIMFLPLTKDELKKILDILFRKVLKNLAKKDITIELKDKAKNYLVDQGYNPQFGARPMKRVIQKLVVNPLSKKLIAEEFVSGDKIIIDFTKKELVFKKGK